MSAKNIKQIRISSTEYQTVFGFESESSTTPKKTLEQAHQIALDIRRFEIDQYWKRASYFWTLIGSTFVAYLAVLNAEKMDHKSIISFAIANIGLVLTFAWFLANRGSKFWQENWENHVALLEDQICGPLYKITIERSDNPNWIDSVFTAPSPYSSSKINQWVGVFVIIIWITLAVIVLPEFSFHSSISWPRLGIGGMTLCILVLMVIFGKSHRDHQYYNAFRRTSQIEDPPSS